MQRINGVLQRTTPWWKIQAARYWVQGGDMRRQRLGIPYPEANRLSIWVPL